MKNRLIGLMCLAFAVSLVAGSASAADPSLVGWWKLDETSGMTAADSSGNANDGTLSGSLYGDSWAAGVEGGALGLNWNGYVNCGTGASLDITADFTLGAWVKPGEGSEGSYMGVGGRLISSPYAGFSLVRHSSGVYRLWTADQATAAVVGASSSQTYTASEWHHVAGVRSGSTCSLYMDGVKAGSANVPVMAPCPDFFHIGMQYANSPTDRLWIGLIDDFRLYNRALSDAEMAALVGVRAVNPSPADGATEVLMGLLLWTSTPGATMYNIYVGKTPTLGQADLFMPSAAPTAFYPMTEPGVTYYWRVDTVSAAGTSQGSVWKFTMMPLTAHFPSPADGAKWVNTKTTATWTAGQMGLTHIVYGGTDRAAVAAGDAGAKLAEVSETSLDASAMLQPNTTYYWRVDEVDASGTVYPGDVWTFSTVDPAGGAMAEYWDNMNFQGEPKVVKVVPEVNFNWGDGAAQGTNSPDAEIPTDLFSCRWTAELNVPVTGTYVLYESSDDGARMWLNNEPVASGWVDRGTTEDRTFPLHLVAGQRYLLVMEMYENGGGTAAYLQWAGPGIAKQIIPQGALMPPSVAFSCSPASGAADVTDTPVLTWRAGKGAAQHDVFLGSSKALVAAGDPSTLQGRFDTTSFTPAKALTWATTYYWKVNEVAADDSTTPGLVSSFTVISRSVIDGFEAYDVVPVTPAETLAGWWKFDDDAMDSSGNGFNGTVQNGPTYVAGVNGQAIHMDGVDDYVVVGSVGISGTMPRTVAGWAKADTTSVTDWTNVFGFTSTPDGISAKSFDIEKIGGANQYCIHVYGWERGFLEVDLEWHHLAATYDGTTVKWYADGQLAGSEAWALDTQDYVQMGKRAHAAGGNWPGSVDDVHIYSAALSLAEIESLAGFVPTAVVSNTWSASGTLSQQVMTDTVLGGTKALEIAYDNTVAPYKGEISRAVALTDWTRGGAEELVLSFHGDAANGPTVVFVTVEDSKGASVTVSLPDPTAVKVDGWMEVTIPLADLGKAGLDLASMASITLGAGDGKPAGAGVVVVDDILIRRATRVMVENFSFEQPGTVKIKGWNGEGVAGTPKTDVPGWSSDTAPADSGVESDTRYPATDGKWTAFLKGGDPAIWQLTDWTIGAGDVFTLKADARITYQSKTLRMTLYYDDNGARVPVGSADVTIGDTMKEFSMTVYADTVPACIGHKLGIEFANSSSNWLGMDNVRLTVR